MNPVALIDKVHGASAQDATEAPGPIARELDSVYAHLVLDGTALPLYALDRDGNCTFANAACAHALGYAEPGELVGKPMHALIHHTHADGSEYPHEQCRIFRAFRRGRDIQVDSEVLWRADGSFFPAEYWARPIVRDAEVVGCVVTFLDVTAQRRAAERWRQSEAQNRELIENSSQGIFIVKDWRLLFANTAFAKMLGHSSTDDLLGLQFSLDPLFPPKERSRLSAYHTARFAGAAAPARYECRALRKDGSELLLENTERLVNWQGKTAIQISSIDIGKYKRTEQELTRAKDVAEMASRAKSNFLASISHEIRTLMTTMIGMTDLLAETELNEQQLRWMHSFNTAGEQLMALVNDVIDLSKIEAAKLDLDHVAFPLRRLVRETMEIMRSAAEAKALSLHCVFGPDVDETLIGDANRLRQVLTNLLSNATKFTERGRIEIRVRRDRRSPRPGKLLFSVMDTGIGISKSKQKEIFAIYNRGDAAVEGKYSGSGLGLAICRQLVEAMDGRMWVVSETGRGSTFFFTAQFDVAEPVDNDQATAPDTPSEAAPPTPLTERALRVLLVEDRAEIRQLVAAFLKDTPCRLETAENGRDALDKFKESRFDVVLMDNQMPIMDGCAATREIRRWEQRQQRARTPVLALTAGVLKEEIQASLDAGCDGHLGKPIRKHTLLQALEQYGRGGSERTG